MTKQAQLGVPHWEIQVELDWQDVWELGGDTAHSNLGHLVRCSNKGGDTTQNSKMWEVFEGLLSELHQVGGWVVGWSNLIWYPTLALNRAELGIRIPVETERGNNLTYLCGKVWMVFIRKHFILACLGENQTEKVDVSMVDEEGGQVRENDLLLACNE